MIRLGSEVELADPASGRRRTVRLVNPGVQPPARGEVSLFSALGRALTAAALRRAPSVDVPGWPSQSWRIRAVRHRGGDSATTARAGDT